MKKYLLLGVLLLPLLLRANEATNYLDFNLKFIPAQGGPSPHSSLAYPVGLLVLAFDTDNGPAVLELTNNFGTIDLSDTIKGDTVIITAAQPLWNSLRVGTNAVQFGTMQLWGTTVDTNAFAVTNVFESVTDRHWVNWSVTVIGGLNAEIIPERLYGSDFFGVGYNDIQDEWWTRGGYSAVPPQRFPMSWRNPAGGISVGDVGPSFQDYLKTGRVNRYGTPWNNIPQDFGDPADTNTVLSVTNLNMGMGGLIYYELDGTNQWEFIKADMPLPLANGDTNPPAISGDAYPGGPGGTNNPPAP